MYECGFEYFGDSHVLINIQFITIALLFVIFDLEILFILTWIISANFLGLTGFFTIYIVLSFFTFGFIYESLDDLIDKFVEVCMGKHGRFSFDGGATSLEFFNLGDMDVDQFINSCLGFLVSLDEMYDEKMDSDI